MLSVLLTSGALSDPVLIYSVERNILLVHAHKHTYTSTYIHTYIHTYTHAYTHIHIYTYIHTHIYLHTYIHAYRIPSNKCFPQKKCRPRLDTGGGEIWSTKRISAGPQIDTRGRRGNLYTCVHAFCKEVMIEAKKTKKSKEDKTKKSYNISFKLIVVESAEKLKEAAVHELGADTCSKVWD